MMTAAKLGVHLKVATPKVCLLFLFASSQYQTSVQLGPFSFEVTATKSCVDPCLDLQGYEPERSVVKEAQRLSKEVRLFSGDTTLNRQNFWINS